MLQCGVDPHRPLIAQVSRLSTWKNPWQVIDVYRLVKQRHPAVQVALIGAMEASDDIEAAAVFRDLQHDASTDPDIHVLADPHLITQREVNAFQRLASVILQRSAREGFGLTTTEAMWKYQPVVGTSATGLSLQITHGKNGYVADDTAACARMTLNLLEDPVTGRELGKQAHEQVRQHFLFPTFVLQYLRALQQARDVLPRR
ncbi:MAG TPA: glycosyltransferase [Ktedonobacteraceae bacterium]|nr:glycosyltransferase [Ktedonobacteraceae bacterium]